MAHVLGSGRLFAASGNANRVVALANFQLLNIGFIKQLNQFFLSCEYP
jgi:hypothetical protein